MQPTPDTRIIFAIKLFHSVIYLFMSVCILYIFYCGVSGRLDRWLWIALGFITAEIIALVSNRMRCPLTTLALHYGDKTGDDLIADWFLPGWMVQYTVPFWMVILGIGFSLIMLRLVFRLAG